MSGRWHIFFSLEIKSSHLKPTDDFLGVYPRELPPPPPPPSLSLNESGVDADKDDRDGRDIAMDLDERSRNWWWSCIVLQKKMAQEHDKSSSREKKQKDEKIN